MDIEKIEARRRAVLLQMEGIRAMAPGTVSEQYLKVAQKGQKEPALRGPYYLWQYYEDGKPVRRRLSGEDLERVRGEVNNQKRYWELCKEYETLTCKLGVLEREAGASGEALKKKPKSPLRKTGKSGGS